MVAGENRPATHPARVVKYVTHVVLIQLFNSDSLNNYRSKIGKIMYVRLNLFWSKNNSCICMNKYINKFGIEKNGR